MHNQGKCLPSSSAYENRCYRVYRLDAADRIDHADVIQAVSDEDAITHVHGLLSSRSLELWERGRFIRRFDPSGQLLNDRMNSAA
jgi:hypothetical protein